MQNKKKQRKKRAGEKQAEMIGVIKANKEFRRKDEGKNVQEEREYDR